MKINAPKNRYISPAYHLHPSQLFPPRCRPYCLFGFSPSYFHPAVLPLYQFLATKVLSCLLGQNYACRDKRQTKKFCREKSCVASSILLTRQKTCFVATNSCLSRQKYACRDKTFDATNVWCCHKKGSCLKYHF